MLLRSCRPIDNVPFAAAPVQIQTVRRRMRGGSQAYLVEADGNCYVAKFRGNPQGTRTLINEWICWRMLQRLNICTPPLRILNLTQCKPELSMVFGSKRIPVSPGIHLGSQCLVDPDKVVTLDFLPAKLLDCVINRADFFKILVLDVFCGQSDRRQAIFLRSSVKRELRFQAVFIDHGQAFGGFRWQIEDNRQSALYFDHSVYGGVARAQMEINATVKRIEQLTKADFEQIITEVPSEWWGEQDRDDIMNLWLQAEKQQHRLRHLVEEAVNQIGQKVKFGDYAASVLKPADLSLCSGIPASSTA